MAQENNSVQQFLNDIPTEDNAPSILDEKIEFPGTETREAPAPEKGEPTNRAKERRRFREWEERLAEREQALIRQEERYKALEELKRQSAPQDVPVEWLRIHGDSPESREAWRYNQELLTQKVKEAREELQATFRAEREQEIRAERQAAQELEDGISSLEEEYSIDLSSNSPAARKARADYLEALTAISPKDRDTGEIKDYGDPHAAYELYLLKKQGSSARAKNLAARGVSETASVAAPDQDEEIRKYLKANGILA